MRESFFYPLHASYRELIALVGDRPRLDAKGYTLLCASHSAEYPLSSRTVVTRQGRRLSSWEKNDTLIRTWEKSPSDRIR